MGSRKSKKDIPNVVGITVISDLNGRSCEQSIWKTLESEDLVSRILKNCSKRRGKYRVKAFREDREYEEGIIVEIVRIDSDYSKGIGSKSYLTFKDYISSPDFFQ